MEKQLNELRISNPDSAELAALLTEIGAAYCYTGQSEKLELAKQYLLEALDINQKLYDGTDHLSTAQTLHDLGLTHHMKEDSKSAIEYHFEALKMRIRLSKDADKDLAVAHSYYGLAKARRQVGPQCDAVEHFKRALSIYECLHRETASEEAILGVALCHTGIAQGYNLLGRCVDARKHVKQAAIARGDCRGNIELDLAIYYAKALAGITDHKLSGIIDEGLELLKSLGGDELNRYTAACRYIIGDAYRQLNNIGEAEKHQMVTIQWFRQCGKMLGLNEEEITMYLVTRDRGQRSTIESEATSGQQLSDQRFLKYIMQLNKLKTTPEAVDSQVIISYFHWPPEVVYPVSRPIRGRCLIINNTFEDDPKNVRLGSELDVIHIQDLFIELGFKIALKSNVQNIKDTLCEEVNRQEHYNYHCFVLFIMSHGSVGTIENAARNLESKRELWEQLGSKNFKAMAGKPKLVMVQACSGKTYEGSVTAFSKMETSTCHSPTEGSEQSESDSAHPPDHPTEIPPKDYTVHQDLLVLNASFPGTRAFRSPSKGSWFIRTVVATFAEQAHRKHVAAMITTVIRRLAQMTHTVNIEAGDPAKVYYNPDEVCSLSERELEIERKEDEWLSGHSSDEDRDCGSAVGSTSLNTAMMTATVTVSTYTKQQFLFPKMTADCKNIILDQ